MLSFLFGRPTASHKGVPALPGGFSFTELLPFYHQEQHVGVVLFHTHGVLFCDVCYNTFHNSLSLPHLQK